MVNFVINAKVFMTIQINNVVVVKSVTLINKFYKKKKKKTNSYNIMWYNMIRFLKSLIHLIFNHIVSPYVVKNNLE
jgi:hypothetical protein